MDEPTHHVAGESPGASQGNAGSRNPWPAVAVALGTILILAVGAVVVVALLTDRSSPQPSSAPTETPTTTPPTPTSAEEPAADHSVQELAELFGTAVWKVQAEGCGLVGTGTAFAVGPRTLITNAHVVSNDATPQVESRDGDILADTDVIGVDSDLDIAVLTTDQDLPTEPLTWTQADDLAEGQTLVALGYPVPDHAFSVTPATVMSFQTDGTTRQALRLDGLIDKGNSGGPALTSTGHVAGVVTYLLGDGYQLIPVAHTYDYLADAIRTIEEDRPGMEVSCDESPQVPTVPDDWDWPDAAGGGSTGPRVYGDDPRLDRLYDACDDGDMAACDQLYLTAPVGSEYEDFGATCGHRGSGYGLCEWEEEQQTLESASSYGDDPFLDELWDECDSGDLVSCDLLYFTSDVGTEYEEFGATCGRRGGWVDGSCS